MTRQTEDIVSVALSQEDKKAFDSLVDRCGMKRQEAHGRVIRWLLRQPGIIQRAALGNLPDSLSQVGEQAASEAEKAIARALQKYVESQARQPRVSKKGRGKREAG